MAVHLLTIFSLPLCNQMSLAVHLAALVFSHISLSLLCLSFALLLYIQDNSEWNERPQFVFFLQDHMQAVREWWENNVMVVGRVGVWRCVLECLATELEYLDQYCLFPLFRLLLQLLFSIRVGRKPDGMTSSDQPSVNILCLFSCFCLYSAISMV